MRLFRGIIIDTRTPFMQVRMETGFVFWTVSKPNMSIRTRVFVAWDYCKGCPADVLLKPKGDKDPITEIDTFSIPVISGVSRVGIIDTTLADIFSSTVDDEDDNNGLLSSSQCSTTYIPGRGKEP